jgi:hypothetical protein
MRLPVGFLNDKTEPIIKLYLTYNLTHNLAHNKTHFGQHCPQGGLTTRELPTPAGPVLSPALCPRCPALVAFVKNGNVWVADVDSGELSPVSCDSNPSRAD